MLNKSSEYLGQYQLNNDFKVIRATGLMRESIACLQMLAAQLGLPYRVDSVEKILRDTIRRGKKPKSVKVDDRTCSKDA